MKRLLIAGSVAVLCTSCIYTPETDRELDKSMKELEQLEKNDFKLTGGENVIRSQLSTAESGLASGEQPLIQLACTVSVLHAEQSALTYSDISKESISDLKRLQKRCGRKVFQ